MFCTPSDAAIERQPCGTRLARYFRLPARRSRTHQRASQGLGGSPARKLTDEMVELSQSGKIKPAN
jgi:hypothetical protein